MKVFYVGESCLGTMPGPMLLRVRRSTSLELARSRRSPPTFGNLRGAENPNTDLRAIMLMVLSPEGAHAFAAFKRHRKTKKTKTLSHWINICSPGPFGVF